jgi:hypothetical protein
MSWGRQCSGRGWALPADAIMLKINGRGESVGVGAGGERKAAVADWPRADDPDQDTDLAAALDTSVAHPARVYDYWLGGKDNFAADREAAEQVIAVNPNVLPGVRANRAFHGPQAALRLSDADPAAAQA